MIGCRTFVLLQRLVCMRAADWIARYLIVQKCGPEGIYLNVIRPQADVSWHHPRSLQTIAKESQAEWPAGDRTHGRSCERRSQNSVELRCRAGSARTAVRENAILDRRRTRPETASSRGGVDAGIKPGRVT